VLIGWVVFAALLVPVYGMMVGQLTLAILGPLKDKPKNDPLKAPPKAPPAPRRR
jgi:hypothetical protein